MSPIFQAHPRCCNPVWDPLAYTRLDEIAAFRTELNDALWEFDDYVEADDFDAEKFAELQALSRKAAPKIHDMLMRMKLEHPHPEPEPSISGYSASSTSLGAFPPGAIDRLPDLPIARMPTPQEDGLPFTPPYPNSVIDEIPEPSPVMGNQAGPDLGFIIQPLQIRPQAMLESAALSHGQPSPFGQRRYRRSHPSIHGKQGYTPSCLPNSKTRRWMRK